MGDIILSGGASSSTGGGSTTIVDGADNSIEATVFDFSNSNPLATVLVDANGDPVFSAGGSAVTIADGADVAEGTTTDAAITSDTSGTVIGFLRGLVKWAFERMPASLGQKAMAASLPVVIASDQTAIPIQGVDRTATGTRGVSDTSDLTIDATDAQTVSLFFDNLSPAAPHFDGTFEVRLSWDGVNYQTWKLQEVTQNNQVNFVSHAANVLLDATASVRTFVTVLPTGIVSVKLVTILANSGNVLVTMRATAQYRDTLASIVNRDTSKDKESVPIHGVSIGATGYVPRAPTVSNTTDTYNSTHDGFVTHIGSGNNAAFPVTVRLGDGTNSADVKAASTAAIATDKAQVVAISPNNVIATSAAGNTSASGTITANGQSVQITVPPGGGGVGIQITGVWTGQIDFQASLDNVTWFSVNTSNGISSVNATSGTGIFILAASGYGYVRAIATAWTSGTATILMNGSVGAGPVLLSSPLPQGANILGSVGIDQTTPGTTNAVSLSQVGGAAITLGQKPMAASTPVVIASDQTALSVDINSGAVGQNPTEIGVADAWWQRITDGTNGPVKVLGASEAVDIADSALVVGLSPNSATVSAAGDDTTAYAVGVQGVDGGVPVDVLAAQGAGAILANAWAVKVTDTANGPVAVKPASTAAVATDPAFVVAVSPNNVVVVEGTKANNGGVPGTTNLGVLPVVASEAAPTYIDGRLYALSTDLTGQLRVTGAGTQYTEDVASAGAESLTLAGAVRSDSPASTQSADGDYANLKTDELGRLWVNASEGQTVDGRFFPAQSVASKLDEVIFTNKQVVAAMLLLLNQVNSRTSVTQRDLILN